MISKAKLKYIKSLQLKKYRKQEQCFVVEGVKSVSELLQSDFDVRTVCCSAPHQQFFESLQRSRSFELLIASENELTQMGSFQSNDGALAVAAMKENQSISLTGGEYGLILDDIRDPGNLGTIIRTADWYGITKIVASDETTELYNPKVISATMGSFTRVQIYYTDLNAFLSSAKGISYGTFLNGEDVHQIKFESEGWIVIGNESNGISSSVERWIKKKITIPRKGKAESLNAAIATAVVLDNLTRLKK